MANHITLLGRLTKDPEVRYVASGKVVTSFTLVKEGITCSQDTDL